MPTSLIEIPHEQWIKLRDLYADRKQDASSYMLIQNYINWVTQNCAENVKIFSLMDWETTGTFILYDQHSHIYCNTLSQNLENLGKALSCLKLRDSFLFAGFQKRIKPAIEEHFARIGIGMGSTETFWYYLPKEDALKFNTDPPAGLKLARLQLENAELVNSVWPHREPGSVKFVELLIKHNENIGIFTDDGELIAWCLRLPLGAVGLLQVVEQHKRKGLGNLAVRYMSKLFAENNFEITAPVVTTNTASRAMFESLGFKVIDNVFWAYKAN